MNMNKAAPITDEQRRLAEAAVVAAWEEGCPVAGGPPEKTADICLRRWQSLSRRKVNADVRADVIRDLARGLISAFEPDAKLVGPLIVDYEHVAGRVLDAIDPPSRIHSE
jgi:hypothetical protein